MEQRIADLKATIEEKKATLAGLHNQIATNEASSETIQAENKRLKTQLDDLKGNYHTLFMEQAKQV